MQKLNCAIKSGRRNTQSAKCGTFVACITATFIDDCDLFRHGFERSNFPSVTTMATTASRKNRLKIRACRINNLKFHNRRVLHTAKRSMQPSGPQDEIINAHMNTRRLAILKFTLYSIV
jgi:hypothetical protein